jgi:hypothetical protein
MRRLQKTIDEIGWTRTVPQLAEQDAVARAFELMSRESHDCVLIARDGRLTESSRAATSSTASRRRRAIRGP